MTHQIFQPQIMYFGTPVVLISSLNEDGTPNLAPMSSAWWLRQSCMLGLAASSKTVENLRRTGECVLNLPSADLVSQVDRLALTTGSSVMPAYKAHLGFEQVSDKFAQAGLTAVASECVSPPRVLECPVQLEAQVQRIHDFESEYTVAIEVKIIRVYMDDSILNDQKRHGVDTDKWHPLIMSFCEFYGLGNNLHPSRLAKVF
jgi:flavin reductase (DIM6/NTAB) family NADH-FMN oxidoreductase RutF